MFEYKPFVIVEVIDGVADVTLTFYGHGTPECLVIDHDNLRELDADDRTLPRIPPHIVERYIDDYGAHPLAEYLD